MNYNYYAEVAVSGKPDSGLNVGDSEFDGFLKYETELEIKITHIRSGFVGLKLWYKGRSSDMTESFRQCMEDFLNDRLYNFERMTYSDRSFHSVSQNIKWIEVNFDLSCMPEDLRELFFQILTIKKGRGEVWSPKQLPEHENRISNH